MGLGLPAKGLHLERERNRWLLSLALTAALLGILWSCFSISFQTNDDAMIMSLANGARTGTPSPSLLFSGYIWGLLLSTLYRITGAAPWYALVNLALIYVSLAAVCKSLLKNAQRSGFPIWLALGLYCALFIGIWSFYAVCLQFTVMSAFCGMGALSLLLATDAGDSRRVRIADLCCAGLFMLLSHSIRVMSSYIALALAFCSIVVLLILDRRGWRRLALWALVLTAAVGVSLGATRIYESTPEWRAFRAYSAQRAEYTDYGNTFYEDDPALYASVGWDEPLHDLVSNHWFFMDERITEENFRTLNEAYDESDERTPFPQLLFARGKALYRRILDSYYLNISAVCLFLLCVTGAALFLGRGAGIRPLLPLGYGFAGLVLLLYTMLHFNGRLLQRAYSAILFPAIACAAVLLPLAYGARTDRPRWLRRAALIWCAALALHTGAYGGWLYAENLAASQESVHVATGVKAAMEDYAVSHHGNIYIHDARFSCAPFRTWPDGKPNNLLSWGGSSMFSPPYYEQLRSLGYDEMYAGNFFDDGVYLLCLEEPPEEFLQYMEARFPGCSYTETDRQEHFAIYKFSRGEQTE